ncbi:MAG: flagellar biosynthetic protein FliO [Nitriliruptoraceae bacterium]
MIDSPLLLLLVLAAIAAVPMVLRRHRASQPDGVRVLSRTALSKSTVVAVLAVGDRRLLIGAADQGVQLLADISDVTGTAGQDASITTTATDADTSASELGRRDAVRATAGTGHLDEDALAALLDGSTASVSTTAGPRIGLVDRLRAMTVRTPVQGRPFHVPLRR